MLAPFYDLLCTIAYTDLAPHFAMKIGKSATLDDIDSGAWSTFAADAGIGGPFVRRRAKALADSVQSALPRVVDQAAGPALDSEALRTYASLITARSARVAKTA